ncbi:MAG TPA: four helix bundle protein [Phycisphaerae bacterium]|nr:four helix bundle protein [Phycisphaerae bacterium]
MENEKNQIKTFRNLVAWQKAKELAKEVYLSTMNMPDHERFGLTSQMRRAAVSIPSNIAEGHGRGSLADYLRFLRTARGSLMELQTQLILTEELGYLKITPKLTSLQAETDRVLQGLIRSLENWKG